jgi:hypothetical protein
MSTGFGLRDNEDKLVFLPCLGVGFGPDAMQRDSPSVRRYLPLRKECATVVKGKDKSPKQFVSAKDDRE